LGWAYTLYGGLPWMQAVFYGVAAAVIGIIANSAYKLTRKSIGGDRLLWIVYLSTFVVTVVTESEIVWLFLAGGVFVWLARTKPALHWRRATLNSVALPVAAALLHVPSADARTLWQVFGYF